MNVPDALLWGFVATVALTSLLEFSRAAGLSRMSLPYVLGTMFTPDRRKAPLIGAGVHFINGFIFAFGYALAFESIGRASWWIGGALGAVHTAFVLAVIAYLPGIHPRMATEQDGPRATRALQPPGFLGLNYGVQTPAVALAAHLVYGAVLGALYTVQ